MRCIDDKLNINQFDLCLVYSSPNRSFIHPISNLIEYFNSWIRFIDDKFMFQ